MTLVSLDLCFFFAPFFCATAAAEGHLAGKPDRAKNKEWRKKIAGFCFVLEFVSVFRDTKGRKKIGRGNKATGRSYGRLEGRS